MNKIFIMTKKICLLVLVLLGLILLTKDIQLFKVKAESNLLIIKQEQIDFTVLSNESTTFESDNFIVTFSTAVTSSGTGVNLVNGNTFNIAHKALVKYITKIEFIGNHGDDDPNVLDVVYAKDGIVSYEQYDYDMTDYSFKTVSNNSISEYPNTTQEAEFNVLENVNIQKINIYYQEVEPVNYTILNLYKGTITFNASTFSGNLLDGTKKDSASYDSTTKFYIVQTIVDVNNNVVKYNGPIDSYNISFTSTQTIKTEVVIDDIWCSYTSGNRYGGISVPVDSSQYKKNIVVKLKGINRFTRINYWTDGGTTSSLTFTSYYGDGSKEGKLIAIGKQTTKSNSVHGTLSLNGWNSTIGGDDSYQTVMNLNFAGGTVIAVSTPRDQCNAIGAGGNGTALINISGGSVTAIAYTTGTAIGGGIGHLSAGGPGTVNITGGEVYAYNMGQPYEWTCESIANRKKFTFVPGTAIGGGSSHDSSGSLGTVNISDGIVKAYSNGGSGLGGGNSISSIGGPANITISGGNVTSYGYIPDSEAEKVVKIIANLQTEFLDKVVSGGSIYKDKNGKKYVDSNGNEIDDITQIYNHGSADGSGIGGGSGKIGNGGTATINITGGILDATSIGGGNSTNASGATATVTVTGGTTICETIGGGFSPKNGYENGFVYVTGGSLNASMSAIPQVSKTDSSMLYLTRISILDQNNDQLKNTIINSFIFKNSYSYGTTDLYTDDESIVYLWLPKNADITGCTIQDNAMLLFEPFEEVDGMISPYEIGILKETQNNKYNYHVNTVTTEFYSLYNKYEDGVLSKELENTTVVSHNTYFEIYAKVIDGYSANVYYAVELANGSKVFQQATTTELTGNIVLVGLTITQDTTIMYEVISNDNSEHYYVMDLYNGNIDVIEVDGQFIVEQNGYRFPLSGELYVTSGGIATPNTISVDIKQDSEGKNNEIGIHLNNIVVGSEKSCLSVLSGKLTLDTGEANDILHSNSESAIYVEENAELVINSDGKDAIKVSTQDSSISPVSGKGKVVFNNLDGYFKVLSSDGTPEFSVGIYECSGRNEINAELFVGEFEFELIGYIQTKDSVTTLYDSSVDMSNNKDSFAARGVYKVLNGITTTQYAATNVVDGNYVVKLTATGADAILGEIQLTQGNNTLHEGVYYKIEQINEKSCVLTIYGKAFENGNIILFAASDQLIAYQIISYNGEYDGLAHGISVAVNTNLFIVTYSTEIDGEYTNENPTRVDVTPVGGIKVYIKIEPKQSGTNYIPVTDVYGTIVITKGTNEFLNTLTCPDVIYEDGAAHAPNPSIISKWGVVTYEYYSDPECTVIASIFEKEKFYYVKAFVSEGIGDDGITVNYDAISTNYAIRFKVVEVLIRTQTSKSLSKVSGAATTITVPLNGAFTVLYKVTASSLDNMTLRFDNNSAASLNVAAPIGTKITFIDFAQESGKVNSYSYYYIDNSNISGTSVIVPLDKFIKMGTQNTLYSKDQQNVAVEFQFCVEFPYDRANSGEISVSLTGTSDGLIKTINVIPTVQSKEEISITNQIQGTNDCSITLQVKSNSAKTKQVLVVYMDTASINDLNLELINPTGAEVELIYSTGKYLYYLLAGSTTIDNSYTFIIENKGTNLITISDIVFSIRSTDSDIPYVLQDQTSTNTTSINNGITINGEEKIEFIASIDGDKYFIENETTVKFKFQTNTPSINYDELTVTIYRKNEMGIYEANSNPIPWVFGERAVPIDMLDKYLGSDYGSYKLIFNYRGVESTIYFIIKK